MDLLGVGPLELVFVLLIAFLIIGPKNIAKTSKTLGKLLNSVNRSESWKAVKTVGEELRSLPTKLMREASIDEFLDENPGLTTTPPKTSGDNREDPDTTPENLRDSLKAWTTPLSPDEETE